MPCAWIASSALRDLRGEAQRRERGHALLDARGERAAGQVLHRDVRVLAGEALVVDARHVLVLERRDQLVFAHEALAGRCASCAQAGSSTLSTSCRPSLHALGEVDLRHAALADHAQRAVARNRHRRRRRPARRSGAAVERNRARERRYACRRSPGAVRSCSRSASSTARASALRREAGLAQEIRRAGLHRLHRDVGVALVGDQDHRRRVRDLADLRHPGEAVLACRIAHRAAPRRSARPPQRSADCRAGAGPIRRSRASRPARAQHPRERAAELARLVDDEEAHSAVRPGSSSHFAGAGQIDKALQNVDHARHAENITMKLFGGGKPDHPMADPKEAKRLLDALPAKDPVKALEELTHWLESVAAAEGFKPEAAHPAAAELDDAAQPRLRKLVEATTSRASRPSRFQENRLWTALHGYWRQAGLRLRALRSTCSCRARRAPKRPRRCCRCCWCARCAASRSRSSGCTCATARSTWRSGACSTASTPTPKRGSSRKPRSASIRAQAANPRRSSNSSRRAMFSASSPDGLLPVEVELAERLIAAVCAALRARRAAGARAGLTGPTLRRRWRRCASSRAPQPGPGLRFFGAGAALAEVHELRRAHAGRRGKLPPELNLGAATSRRWCSRCCATCSCTGRRSRPSARRQRHAVKSRLVGRLRLRRRDRGARRRPIRSTSTTGTPRAGSSRT